MPLNERHSTVSRERSGEERSNKKDDAPLKRTILLDDLALPSARAVPVSRHCVNSKVQKLTSLITARSPYQHRVPHETAASLAPVPCCACLVQLLFKLGNFQL